VDLDDCRDPETGVLEPWAADAVATLNSYTEVSPSGTGVKVFVRSVLPAGGRSGGHFEFYDRQRYFTLTGKRLPNTPPPWRPAAPVRSTQIIGGSAGRLALLLVAAAGLILPTENTWCRRQFGLAGPPRWGGGSQPFAGRVKYRCRS